MANPNVIHPLGWAAGRELDLAKSLEYIAIEMLAQRSDLIEIAKQMASDTKGEGSSDLAQSLMRRRIADLERYAVAVKSLALQLAPENFSPATHGGLLEMARMSGITLPAWMNGEKE